MPDEMYVCSVDGIHFRICELRKEPSKDWISYKNKYPGVAYELALHVYDGRLIWINGPFKASTHDDDIFQLEGGLKEKIPMGRKAIGDKAYTKRKNEKKACGPNKFDEAPIKKLKERAKARQETFNGRLRSFKILSDLFRSKGDDRVDKHRTVLVAACILTQFNIENGHSLFDV